MSGARTSERRDANLPRMTYLQWSTSQHPPWQMIPRLLSSRPGCVWPQAARAPCGTPMSAVSRFWVDLADFRVTSGGGVSRCRVGAALEVARPLHWACSTSLNQKDSSRRQRRTYFRSTPTSYSRKPALILSYSVVGLKLWPTSAGPCTPTPKCVQRNVASGNTLPLRIFQQGTT